MSIWSFSKKISFVLPLVCWICSTADASVTLYGAVDQFKPQVSGYGAAMKSEIGYGGGVELGYNFSRRFEFDFGALYLLRRFQDSYNSATFGVLRSPTVQLSLLMRFWPTRYFSLGGGGYYGILGALQVESSGRPAVYGFGNVKNDLGLIGSASFSFRIGRNSSLVLDGRYLAGMSNFVDSQTVKFLNRETQLLVGVRFGLIR